MLATVICHRFYGIQKLYLKIKQKVQIKTVKIAFFTHQKSESHYFQVTTPNAYSYVKRALELRNETGGGALWPPLIFLALRLPKAQK